MIDKKKIDAKWQKYWEEKKVFAINEDPNKEKYYYLIEFPYPSGSGLHVGHIRSYVALDIMARKKRMQGFNVLYPIGWDAFGAPAEQFAIKNHIYPSEAVSQNIETFKNQIKKIGISFDWDREFSTTDPEYYKWTQWQFLKFFEHDMAYKAKAYINWCPMCKTGLSNEDSAGGVCERCGSLVEQKEKEQWMLKMSSYAEDLIKGLDETSFQDKIKTAQINWIGKSVGAEIDFRLNNREDVIKVWTTRPDTIYGVSFLVIAPEHPLIGEIKEAISNIEEVNEYIIKAKKKTNFERSELNKEKSGIEIKGITAINPINNERVPIFVADYVLMSYATGAVMGVAAHDARDYEFAIKYGLPIKQVIQGDVLPYIQDGIHINSQMLNNLSKEEAIIKIIEYLEEKKLGRKKISYKLQDWVFSRQRFWGEPIPLIDCEECGWVPVPYESLPVLLPIVQSYEPTENGESPLANIENWVQVKCPKCGRPAKRETDTMPNWAGSSWYWLRYMDAHNKDEFASFEKMKYWGQVDWYNGGMEHATRHLLYARFWNQFLYNIGLVPFKEPFKFRVAHGMVLGENGLKMSKSLGNVINPNDVVAKFGADTLRLFMMFMGDYEKEVSWSENGVKGCSRFIDRIINLGLKLNEESGYSSNLEKIINKTIMKVTEDIDNMKFNTAISSLMILANGMEKEAFITKDDYRTLVHLLNPFMPHISEELNETYGLGTEFCLSTWPTADATKIKDEFKTVAVQINGKLRTTIEVSTDLKNEELISLAKENKIIKNYLTGQVILKEIVIPNRLVNFVIQK